MSLITTIDEFVQAVSIDVNTDFNTILPSIKGAEDLYIKDLISTAFYDELQAAYDTAGNDVSAMSADNQKLMPLIQRVIAYYSLYLGITEVIANFGDAGLQHNRGENTEPAPLWKVNKYEIHMLQYGDMYAEKLLEFLEANSSPSKYNTWYASDKNTKNEGWMVNSAIVAGQYIDINNSRRIFLRLKKRIKDIEYGYIKSLICSDQYDEIVTQIKADSLTSQNTELVNKLRPIIAKMALYVTIPSLKLVVTGDGIQMNTSNDGVVSKNSASDKAIAEFRQSLKEEEFGYLSDVQTLEQFIKDNISDYPLIAASPCYTIEVVPGPTWQPVNDPDSKHFSV